MKKAKNILVTALFFVLIFGLSLSLFLLPKRDVSPSERRPLKQMPEFSLSELQNGKLISEFEGFLTDQFPLRDSFRALKAKAQFGLYFQKDNAGYFIKDGYLSKINSTYSDKSLEHFFQCIKILYDGLPESSKKNVYYSIIPEKNYYLIDGDYPSIDYEKLFFEIDESLSYMNKIDIKDELSLDCFYFTDTHWRQEKILPVSQKISEAMGNDFSSAFEKKEICDFYGVYSSQSGIASSSEKIFAMENESTNNSTVYNFETRKESKVYDLNKLGGFDSYDVFLSGPCSLLKIKNPEGKKDKRLLVFRDSFGSSLVPLLMGDYGEILVADTRYIVPKLLFESENFENCDVLFLYSTLLVCDSSTLKK